VPSGRTHLSRVAICLSHEAHCSGSCLTVVMVEAPKATGAHGFGTPKGPETTPGAIQSLTKGRPSTSNNIISTAAAWWRRVFGS
jgi:hypothetical protein